MRVGVICSSGGAVFAAAMDLLRSCGYTPDAVVVTDRPCGAEKHCERLGIPWRRIEDPDRVNFSRKAAAWLYDEGGADWSCLFFSRLVSAELYARVPCVNIHPSLLPAFPGFGAVSGALESRSRFIGATAHLADESTDAGGILGQVIAPIPYGASVQLLERLSFAQKLYLFLVMHEFAERKELVSLIGKDDEILGLHLLPWASPALRNQRLADHFDEFLEKEEIVWLR